MTRALVQQLISFIDLTTLDSKDTDEKVLSLVKKANGANKPAAICVYPNFADLVCAHTNLPVAVVAGCFPTGQTFIEAKVAEIELAARSEASEIDIVINRGKVIEADYDYLKNEVAACRKAAQNKILKVILESGELNSEQIQKSAAIAIKEGADFIKTSTGKSEIGATTEAAQIMCREIKSAFNKTGKKIGFKPSGGIRTYDDAIGYYNIVLDILGEDWLKSELFRIGASSLFDNLNKDLATLE